MACPCLVTIPPTLLSVAKTASKIPYHTHTLYLFTANDFATFAIPTTLFATFAALSGSPLTTNPTPSLLPTLSRIPLALAVTWTNLLLFNISNQRSLIAIEEDRVNKPHRPLPSNRLTSEDARRLLLVTTPLVILQSYVLGVWEETLLLVAFTWAYNDLGGSDEHWLLRNLLIALGYGLYSSAALRTMASPAHALTPQGLHWIAAITAIMFATQHICDIKDAAGDALRGRKSAPVVLGDTCVRYSVAVPILVCSGLGPLFFGLGWGSYVVTCGMGALVAYRTLVYRDLASDKVTWKLWALWTCVLFALPLVGSPSVFGRAWVDVRALLLEVKCLLCAGDSCAVTLDLAAASGIAMVVEGRRIYKEYVGAHNGTAAAMLGDTMVG